MLDTGSLPLKHRNSKTNSKTKKLQGPSGSCSFFYERFSQSAFAGLCLGFQLKG